MEFHKFSKKSIAIFAVFALILFGLAISDASPLASLLVIVVSSFLTVSVVTWIEAKRDNN